MERGGHGIDKLLLEPGRRVVLVFTDGVDMPMNFSGRNKSLKDVMKRAEERDVMVYAIGLAGETGMPDRAGGGRRPRRPRRTRSRRDSAASAAAGWAATRPQLEKPDEGLPKIAAATGGGYFELTSARDLGVDLCARRRRAPSSVRAGVHAGKARRQDARPDRPRVAARSHRAGAEAVSRVEAARRRVGGADELGIRN